ncbi:Glutathione transferase FosA [compost metagenome]
MITLNHTIVPVRDKQRSAAFYSAVFGFSREAPLGPFAVVRVNDSLTLDFAENARFDSHHYAFQVSDTEFDAIFARIRRAGIAYYADPHHQLANQINTRRGGRGLYFEDPDGHHLEILTR